MRDYLPLFLPRSCFTVPRLRDPATMLASSHQSRPLLSGLLINFNSVAHRSLYSAITTVPPSIHSRANATISLLLSSFLVISYPSRISHKNLNASFQFSSPCGTDLLSPTCYRSSWILSPLQVLGILPKPIGNGTTEYSLMSSLSGIPRPPIQ